QAPPGEYGDYVRRTLEAENADRLSLMKQLAAERRVPMADIEAEQAALWRERAFPGEWIEAQGTDGTWRWEQKQGTRARTHFSCAMVRARATRPAHERPPPPPRRRTAQRGIGRRRARPGRRRRSASQPPPPPLR